MGERALCHLAALFTVLNWGTTFIATKILLRAFTPAEILIFRFVLGVVALFVACPHLLRVRDRRQELTFAAEGLTGACLYYLMENIALSYTTAANVGVIVSAAPLFTALFAWAMGKEEGRPNARFFLGFVTAMAGICLISFPSLSAVALDWRGDLLALGAAAVWGVLPSGTADRGLRLLSAPDHPAYLPIRSDLYAPFRLPEGFSVGAGAVCRPPYTGTFLYLGIGACALCFVTWGFAVGVLGAVKTSVYIYLSPVITLVCSAAVLHESMPPASLGGAVLTLLGLILSQ